MTESNACRDDSTEVWASSDDMKSVRAFITPGGGLGIVVHGHGIVMPVQQWHDAVTHPEAQGNKDLGEPAASGLEVTEEMVLRGAIKLASDENHPTLFTQGFDEDGVCAAVRQIYLRRSRTILQAALAAAPTSPQPIKGESELESASNGMGLR